MLAVCLLGFLVRLDPRVIDSSLCIFSVLGVYSCSHGFAYTATSTGCPLTSCLYLPIQRCTSLTASVFVPFFIVNLSFLGYYAFPDELLLLRECMD